MGSEWKIASLGDLMSVKHGYAFKGDDFSEKNLEGPIVVTIGNFDYTGGFRFESTRLKRCISEYPDDYELHPGEVLLAMTCQTSGGEILGIPGVVPNDGETYLHNQRLGKVVLESDQADLGFLYWLFLSHGFNHHLCSTATGTKILHTAPKRIESYEFSLPPLPEQKAIAHILGTLDDKIELNRRMNATLEGMAQTLFKSWFVDFDPVIDNALAAGNPIPDELAPRAEVRKKALAANSEILHSSLTTHHSLFPAAFQETESMGWIPEGWEVGSLDDVLVLQRGFDLPKAKRTEGAFPLMVSSGQDGTHVESKVKGPGVVTGRSGKLGVVSFVHHDFWPLNTTLWVKEYKRSSPYHAYFLLKTLELDRFNAGSAVATLNRNHISNMHQYLPVDGIVSRFSEVTGSLFRRIERNVAESQNLSKLRDTLLPKLISGELQIQEAKKVRTP